MGTNNRWSIWKDEAKVELAKTLFAAGVSASEAAYQIGGVSRNAVIGKWHRMGLQRAFTRPKKQKRVILVRTAKSQREKLTAMRAKRVRLPPLPVEALPPPAETDIARVSLMELERHHCRFPVGDPKDATFGFCGCKAYEGLPYCEAHAHRAFRSEADRPKNPESVRPIRTFPVGINRIKAVEEFVDA